MLTRKKLEVQLTPKLRLRVKLKRGVERQGGSAKIRIPVMHSRELYPRRSRSEHHL